MAIIVPRRIPHFQKPEFVSLSNINDSSIVDFLPLTEGAGTPRNLVGNEVSLVNPNNAISWSADQTEGRVLKHGGTSDNYITWSMSDDLTVDNVPFTVVFSHRPDAVAVSSLSAFSLGSSGVPRDTTPALLVQYNNSLLRFYMAGGYRITTSVSAGVLHRAAVTWKDQLWTAYLNGEEIGTFSGQNISDRPSAYYGSGYNGSSAGVYGNLAIYSRALSSSEIRTDYERNGLQVIEPRRRWVPVVIDGGAGATVSVGLASELSTAFAISRLKQKAVGLSAESDTALATTPEKVTAIGLSTETDTAFSILRSKIKTAGFSAETDSAFALIISSAVNVGLSDETDSALSINRLKQNPVGLSNETDTALSIGRSKIKIAGLGIETDVAFTISRSKLKALGLSSEVDQALAISSSGSLAVGLASELDVALVIGRLKQQALGIPTETDTSQPVGKIKTQQAGLSVESDTALDVTSSSGRVVGLATETDLAQSISRIKQRLIGLAPETDVALSITIAGVTVVINTNAKETLKLLAENPTLTLSAENATLTLS